MALIAGIDGCRESWVCVSQDLSTGRLSANLLRGSEFRPIRWATAAIDVPIGLPRAQPRAADREARLSLGSPRASSVFPCPYRSVLPSSSWEEMNQSTRALTGKGVSKQSFGILPKVREIDELVRASLEARACLVEFHPEVTFAAWAGHPMRHRKKSVDGRRERRQLIDEHFGSDAFVRLKGELRESRVPDDDLADAFAGLWTAARILSGEALSLPQHPEIDEVGLRMQIVY